LASVAGGFGTVDYTAANAFLDALAHRNSAGDGPRTVSILWGHWQLEEIGEDLLGQVGRRTREQQAAAIRPEEGMQVLDRILANPVPQILVSPRDLSLEIDAIDELRQEEEAQTRQRSSGPASRPSLDTPYVPPRDDLEDELVELWKELLGIEEVGVLDNFYQLGGHSLLATQVASRIRDTFRIELPLDEMLARPTVADIAAAIAARQAQRVDGADLAKMVDEIQQLSADELRELLAAEDLSGLTEQEQIR
jgi:acyl carrier protein